MRDSKSPTLDPFRLETLFAPAQDRLACCGKATERLFQGFMSMALQQAELGRSLMEDGLTEMRLLTAPRRPEEYMEAELEIMRKRMDRMISGMRQINDEMRTSYFEASELALAGLQAETAGQPAKAPSVKEGVVKEAAAKEAVAKEPAAKPAVVSAPAMAAATPVAAKSAD